MTRRGGWLGISIVLLATAGGPHARADASGPDAAPAAEARAASHGAPTANPKKGRAVPVKAENLGSLTLVGGPTAGTQAPRRRQRELLSNLPERARGVHDRLLAGGRLPIGETGTELNIDKDGGVTLTGIVGAAWEHAAWALAHDGALSIDADVTIVLRKERIHEARVTVDGVTYVLVAPIGTTVRTVSIHREVQIEASPEPIQPASVATEPSRLDEHRELQTEVEGASLPREPEPPAAEDPEAAVARELGEIAAIEAALRELASVRRGLADLPRQDLALASVDTSLVALTRDVDGLWQNWSSLAVRVGRRAGVPTAPKTTAASAAPRLGGGWTGTQASR